MSVVHLPKPPLDKDAMRGVIQFIAVCGTSTWDVSLTTEDVSCLRCRGTAQFWNLHATEGASPKPPKNYR